MKYTNDEIQNDIIEFKQLLPSDQKQMKKETKLKLMEIKIKKMAAKTGMTTTQIIEMLED